MTRPPVSAVAAGVVAVLGLAGLIRGAVPAAAYFTVYNTTDTDDTLTSVASGAGSSAAVMTDDNGSMRMSAAGLRIRAHSSVTLSGKAHVMIEHLLGTLRPGQYVNLELTFANAGPVNVSAPVIAINAKAPQ